MVAPLTVTIYYDRSVTGREALAKRVEAIFRGAFRDIGMNKWRHTDPREAYIHSDVAIHLDWPVLEAIPWAHVSICVRNRDAWCTTWEESLTYPGVDCIIDVEDLEVFDNVAGGVHTALEFVFDRRPSHGVHHCPPVLRVEDCPKISIITPTYGRKGMIDIAFHNLMATDYPAEKIEWVVVEDAERSEDMASDKIINFQVNYPQITMKYIPIQGRMTIGQKRNIGVENATADILLFMDDDDHYPPTSFRRRVAWLLHGRRTGARAGVGAVACSSIALYDLKRGVSAVNVPPFQLPLCQRISEATLTFTRAFWERRKFPDVSLAEGEEWVRGREEEMLLIPPQQIIVAFSHDGNASQRRIPPVDAKVSCFWGFPKEYLVFIHRLAGVQVEEDTSGPQAGGGVRRGTGK
jgi:hypothetical protein